MKILMTGATGLLGSALMPELLKSGHEVTALVRNPRSALVPQPVKLLTWHHGKIPAEAFDQVEAILHLAGENVADKRWSKERKRQLYDSRVGIASQLKEGLGQRRLKLYLTASGAGYYGERGNQILTEVEPPGMDFLAQLCVDWERSADAMPADRILKARFGIMLSREGGFLAKVEPMFKRFGASRLGDGQQWVPWVHIDDVVSAMVRALDEPTWSGAINVTAPEPVTNSVLTEELRKHLRAWPGPPAPRLALRLLYGELADALLFSQRAHPTKLTQWGFRFRYPQLPEALISL